MGFKLGGLREKDAVTRNFPITSSFPAADFTGYPTKILRHLFCTTAFYHPVALWVNLSAVLILIRPCAQVYLFCTPAKTEPQLLKTRGSIGLDFFDAIIFTRSKFIVRYMGVLSRISG
jgi:hypothetical protein